MFLEIKYFEKKLWPKSCFSHEILINDEHVLACFLVMFQMIKHAYVAFISIGINKIYPAVGYVRRYHQKSVWIKTYDYSLRRYKVNKSHSFSFQVDWNWQQPRAIWNPPPFLYCQFFFLLLLFSIPVPANPWTVKGTTSCLWLVVLKSLLYWQQRTTISRWRFAWSWAVISISGLKTSNTFIPHKTPLEH